MDKTSLINAIKALPFNEENFEFLKQELIKSAFPKSISEKVEDAISGVRTLKKDREDILNDWEKKMRLWTDEMIERKFPPYNNSNS